MSASSDPAALKSSTPTKAPVRSPVPALPSAPAATHPVGPRPDLVLGQSVSTLKGYRASDNLILAFRLARNLPELLTQDEISGENAKYYFMTACAWVSNRCIPLRFKVLKDERGRFDRFVPENPKQRRACVPPTLLGCIGKHLIEVRQVFPDHPDWSNNQDPPWWSPMRAKFLKDA